MHIFLIGFMGSGKSFWSGRWADEYHIKAIDLDHEIEQAAGKKITDIFREKGEQYFRKLEAEVLRQINTEENSIIACGGGTPCFEHNLRWMKEHGTVIYLEASPETL